MTLTASSFRPRTIWREVQSIRQFCDNRLGWLLDLSQTVGDFGTYRFGHWQGVMVNSSELAHALLVEHADAFHKPQVFRFLKTLIGNGLLTSDGEEWRSQRHLAAPAFQHRRIAAYAQVIANYAEQAQAEWHDGAKIDVVNEMMRLTLRIAGKTLFDTDVLGDTEEIGVALGAALHYIDQQGSRLLAPPPSWPTPANLRHRKTIARLDAIVARMIAERRASGEDKGDLLSMLLAVRDEGNGAGMTDRQVRDEAMTLLLAGHETTAIVLAWSLVLLARHPHIYARLRDEACAALCGRTPTFEDLPKLPYALQVFKEAMRLYPPVYVTARSATRDVELHPVRRRSAHLHRQSLRVDARAVDSSDAGAAAGASTCAQPARCSRSTAHTAAERPNHNDSTTMICLQCFVNDVCVADRLEEVTMLRRNAGSRIA